MQKTIDYKALCDNIMPSDQNNKILTIQEVADILRVHRSTVSRYAKTGEIKSYCIGNRRLFKEIDVWQFFENQIERICVDGKES